MVTALRPRTQLSALTDGQLLTRFARRGDQGAFATLVQRHGPMVLGVCRRVLHHDQDTEDAFQATFVVLARKASSISNHDSVASWLYKVAFRVALRSRAATAKRLSRERLAEPRSQSPGLSEVVRLEMRQVLDEEMQRLPEKYRQPLLLCYVQGHTNEQAAAQLHWPTGTVKIRLLRGRELLRKRLERRGLALSLLAGLATCLEAMAKPVPQPLARAAVECAVQGAPVAVSQLAQATLQGMCLAKLKVAAVVLVTLGLLCLAEVLGSRAQAAEPVAGVKEQTAPLVPGRSDVTDWRASN